MLIISAKSIADNPKSMQIRRQYRESALSGMVSCGELDNVPSVKIMTAMGVKNIQAGLIKASLKAFKRLFWFGKFIA